MENGSSEPRYDGVRHHIHGGDPHHRDVVETRTARPVGHMLYGGNGLCLPHYDGVVGEQVPAGGTDFGLRSADHPAVQLGTHPD